MTLLIALLTGAAHAADEPGRWWTLGAAAAYQPLGALVEGKLEHRAPVMRYGGVAFNNTFIGAGGRVTATPAFAEGAARFSFQPIDLLPITVEAVYTNYWDSPFGMVGFNRSEFAAGTDGPDRKPMYQAGDGFAGHMLSVVVTPQLQMKVGPVVGFTAWTTSFVKILPQVAQEDPWVFDPYRGMVVGYDDILIEHTSAILYEHGDGIDRNLLRVGPAARGKWSSVTPDRSLGVGAVAQFRPGRALEVPTFLVIVAPYLQDPDLIGPVPFMAMTATWEAGN